jgi:pimeloyl-ACP methyl ester carboxylesterase
VTGAAFFAGRRQVTTPSGTISYVEHGSGAPALFVHGVLLNSYLWRHQLAALGDLRRCIAVDLMAHGNSEVSATQDVSVTANAHMLAQFLDALKIDRLDVVGNDSGGGICQIFAALYPTRVRTLALTDCDAHDNWPPEAFKGFVSMVAAGGLAGALEAMLADKSVYRSPQALGLAYERPAEVADDTIETYLRPHLRSPQRLRQLERFINAFDCRHTLDIEAALRSVQAPTLIAWGTDDIFFDLKWSHWLEKTIPGSRRRLELQGGRIFFPEERAGEFNEALRSHWVSTSESASH